MNEITTFHNEMVEKYGRVVSTTSGTEFIYEKRDRRCSSDVFGGLAINDLEFKVRTLSCGTHHTYNRWKNIVQRATSEKYKAEHLEYRDATICSEWLIASNFLLWFKDNVQCMDGVQDTSLYLDKDLLYKGNKLYSPDRCVLVPVHINSFFVSKKRTSMYPMGVSKKGNRFIAYIYTKETGNRSLGTYDTPEQAHRAWQVRKLELGKLIRDSNPSFARYMDRALNSLESDIIANAITANF